MPELFELEAQAKPDSPEYRVLMKNHVFIDGRRLPYMDVLNHFRNSSTLENGRSGCGYYHVGEVGSLAAMYLANHLRVRGLTAKFTGLFLPERERIEAILREEEPRSVAITTTFYESIAPVEEIIRFVRKHSPKSKIIVGGPLIDNLTLESDARALEWPFEEMGADIYVRESQGEESLGRVVDSLRYGKHLDRVPNLYLRQAQAFRYTGALRENNSLDECAINWDLFSNEGIGEVIQTRTARSCAFACSFCDYPSRAGVLTVASVATVERELRSLERLGVRHVVFVDDTFNVPLGRFRELCQMMIRNEFGFDWYSYFRCSQVKDDFTFDLMKESGCKAVFLGIESGDPHVLQNMNKAATLDQYRYGIEQLQKRGIITFASFFVGFPGETEQSIQNTINFINEASPTFFRSEPWWYGERAPIGHRASEFGIVGKGYEWRHATMDIHGACQGMEMMFDAVRTSIWCPQHSFSFWALPYLFGKGMTVSQVTTFLHHCQELMRFNNLENPVLRNASGADALSSRLATFCSGLTLKPPKYCIRHDQSRDAIVGSSTVNCSPRLAKV